MYKCFFGLPRSPFSLTPDPDFLFLTPQHREALAGLSYAILGCKGFVVLTGDAGTGKTTLLMRTMRQLSGERIQTAIIVNPTLSPAEFLEAAMLDFGFTSIPPSKAQRLAMLQEFLSKGRQEGKVSALVVDEAHKLSLEVLEEIRLLGNFESAEEKLLQVVLLGQNELDDQLGRDHLRQFKQRIAFRMQISPLTAGEVGAYIQHRWTTAGGWTPPFSADVVQAVADASQGIPRLINVICDNALIEAFAEGSKDVKLEHVAGVCRELRLAPVTVRHPASAAASEPLAPASGAPVEAVEFEPVLLPSLERYNVSKSSPPGLLGRLFRWNQRVETA